MQSELTEFLAQGSMGDSEQKGGPDLVPSRVLLNAPKDLRSSP